MKLVAKYLIVALVILLVPIIGVGQHNSHLITKEVNKLNLTSPLDRLYKFPKGIKQNRLQQRSIFEVEKLPLFCKIEHKLSKNSNVNLRMRLGSLDYVNKLEGKN